ncbi:MAG: hypothetical protein LBU37_15005 [Tannerellaceae bacterium]|jgi:hypothetical protein|nr:hypothetical protein [Tannerellaceae bacterium]
MKKLTVTWLLLIAALHSFAQTDYYFGKDNSFDSSIPSPEQFFGFPVGSSLARYDKVAEYYKLLAELSGRAQLEVIGTTYENREHIVLIITSPDNLANLERIRRNHLKLTDPDTPVSDYNDQKVIVHLGYNVHGGEIAGTEAALLTAWYLAASANPETLKDLEQTVVIIEPALNPDGRDRAASYFNTFKSTPAVADPADIEHAGGFTPHRGNHFWTDLNRDWFPLVHVESRARVDFYHKWYPNIYADYHEMGSNSTYYFEPSPPRSTWNPTIPEETYNVLNPLLARYYAQALDQTGSLYYTKEDFDNISPIYGSTYPDFQGGVGTTLEVGSSSGIEIETETGVRKFSRNIKDNLTTSLAAIKAAVAEKEILFKHQKDFFAGALALANKRADRYVVFGDRKDRNLTRLFLDHLLAHKVEVYELPARVSQNGKAFEPGSAYVVPFAQPQYRIANAIFEENTQFVDSIFMDITAWSTAHGYGIPFVKTKETVRLGARVTSLPPAGKGGVSRKSDYAYIFDYTDYLAPKSLYYLLDKGVVVKAAYKDFSITADGATHTFNRGAIVIPVAYQTLSSGELYTVVKEAAALTGISITGVTSGASATGIDLGSNNIRKVDKPVAAILAGDGINWTEVGEIWFLLGNRLNIPLTKINISAADRINLNRYTSLILADGNYTSLSPGFIGKLQQWVASGGTLITARNASKWAIDNRIATGFAPDSAASGDKDKEEYKRLDYVSQRENEGPQRIGGVIFEADLDITNPLAFGVLSRETYSIKAGNYQLPRPRNKYATVLQLTDKPQISGYLTNENRQLLKNAPLVVFENKGSGTIVLFSESPTFRGYWLSTGRILSNALFFGKNVSSSTGRYRP